MAKQQQIITEVSELQSNTVVVIKRDGIPQTDGMRFDETLAWMHKHSSMSMDWALRHEGYSVHQEIFRVDAVQFDGMTDVQVKFTERAANMTRNKLAADIGTLYKSVGWERITGPAIKF